MTRRMHATFVVLAAVSLVSLSLAILRNISRVGLRGLLHDPFTIVILLPLLLCPVLSLLAFVWPRSLLLVLMSSGVIFCVGFLDLLPFWLNQLLSQGTSGGLTGYDFALLGLCTMALPTAYIITSAVVIVGSMIEARNRRSANQASEATS